VENKNSIENVQKLLFYSVTQMIFVQTVVRAKSCFLVVAYRGSRAELSVGWVDPRVGLGRVENGSKICVFNGLGWVMGLKWQTLLTVGRDCQPRKLNQLNLFVGGCV